MGSAVTHQQQSNSPHSLIFGPRVYNPFPRGTKVEVRTNDKGFEGVYFTGTVLGSSRVPPKNDAQACSTMVRVRYNDLLRDDGTGRLTEDVNLSFVRPVQPSVRITTLEPGDIVDAFYNDGWWNGIVTRVLKGGEMYVVTFAWPPDEREFRASELRVHLDRVSGSWVRPPRDLRVAGLTFCVGRKVELSIDGDDCRDAWFPGTIHSELENGAYLVEFCSPKSTAPVKVTISETRIRPYPPPVKDARDFDLLENIDAFFEFGWWNGIIKELLQDGRYIVFFKQLVKYEKFHRSELRPHMEWRDAKWFTSSGDEVPEHHMPGNSAVTNQLNDSGGRNDSCDQTMVSLEDNSEQVTIDNQIKSHVSASPPKSRRQTFMSQNALSQPRDKQEGENGVGAAREKGSSTRSSKDTVSSSVAPMLTSASKPAARGHPSDTPSLGKRKRRNSGATQNAGSKRRIILSKVQGHNASPGVQVLDVSGGKTKEANLAVEIENVACEEPNSEFDENQPLSKWRGMGIQSAPAINGSKLSSTMDECMENGKEMGDSGILRAEDSVKQPECGKNTNVSVLDYLPFVENTTLWKAVESMEVFQRMPQKPHFKPLEDLPVSSREGLAIGYMVTFSSVVAEASNLQLNDPESVAEDILETLANLERYGFDVKVIQKCVTEFLVVREKHEKHVNEVKRLNNQLMEHNQEMSSIEEELRQLKEKVSLAESAKEEKKGEIESLQGKLKEGEDAIKYMETEFTGIALSVGAAIS